jgi:hypothetical protein
MTDKPAYQHALEVQEIIGKTPSWAIRWGISSILGAAGLLLLLSVFITYPDTARLPVNILSDTSPQYIVQVRDEKIVLIRSGGRVAAGDTIAAAITQTGKRYAIKAGYAGTLVPMASADTPAVVIPPGTGYSFAGLLPAGLSGFFSGPLRVALLVQQNDPAGNPMVLHGQLTSISPAINGQCTCRGVLDSQSEKKLTNENAFTSSCRGTLEIRLSEKSLFSVLVKKTFGI